MGTTAQKGAYLNDTKSELKQAINNLGGSIDDNTTFRNYANQLQNVYDNLPKTEYQEGTEVNLGKTIKGKLDYDNGVVGIGQDEQDSTTGINLFVDITTQTLNGMTLTRTDNGYILNGTTTDNTTFRGIISNPINSNKTLVAKCNATISDANVQIKTRSSNASQLRSITLSTADTWVVSSGEFQDAMCDIYIKTGTTLNNALLQPMLLNGTYTTINVPDYEKYTGGQASPNPSYRQQIKSVTGEQTVYAKDENNNVITTHQLSLGDIQLNAIGNYKDELIYDVENDRVYKNEKIGEINIDGTQGSFSKPSTNRFNIDGIITDYKKLYGAILCMSNYYKAYAQRNTNDEFNADVVNTNYAIELTSNSGANAIRIKDTRYDDITQYQTWLSNNIITFYYVLATPTLTEITDTTLKNQVKALYNARSNNGTTIITSNGNLPLVIKVRALKGE